MPGKFAGKQEAVKAQSITLSPEANAAIKRYGGGLFKKGALSTLKQSLQQLEKAPQNEWKQIIEKGSNRYFNSEQREAARKVLTSTTQQASVKFREVDNKGRPSNAETELRMPSWTYADGKLQELVSNLKAGMDIPEAVVAAGIDESLVRVYRIYGKDTRRSASLDLLIGKYLPKDAPMSVHEKEPRY